MSPPAAPDGRLHVASLRALVFRAPVAIPVRTSFGTMRDRPCVLVRAEDAEGRVGWGEIWCNFPAVGPEHRARLVDSLFAPLLEGQSFDDAAAALHMLTGKTSVLALQCGEPGPFAQCIAGIDIALWDLAARTAGQPLWRFLGGRSPAVAVYASGLHPDDVPHLAPACQQAGHRAFKLKLGFGRDRDIASLEALRTVLGPQATMMADVNQGWTLPQALAMAPALDRFALDWLEEPLRADRPWTEWLELSARCATRLAAGENLMGEASFACCHRRRGARGRATGCGQVGWLDGNVAGCAARACRRAALLPALARGRRRLACFRPPAGGRRRRRPARDQTPTRTRCVRHSPGRCGSSQTAAPA